jgi:hypothetical protein
MDTDRRHRSTLSTTHATSPGLELWPQRCETNDQRMPTSGGCSVWIVRSRTQATKFVFYVEQQVRWKLTGDTEVLCPQHMPPHLESNPGRKDAKPVTNRLAYGMGSAHCLWSVLVPYQKDIRSTANERYSTVLASSELTNLCHCSGASGTYQNSSILFQPGKHFQCY